MLAVCLVKLTGLGSPTGHAEEGTTRERVQERGRVYRLFRERRSQAVGVLSTWIRRMRLLSTLLDIVLHELFRIFLQHVVNFIHQFIDILFELLTGFDHFRIRLRLLLRLRIRSEEHTSELQSQSNLVCRLLLEKKK